MWQWRNHPPTRPLACRPVNGLIKLQASTLTSPTLVRFFCSSPVQPRSTAAEPSSPKPVVSLLPKASPEIVIQAPPSASRWRGSSCSRSQTSRTDTRAGIARPFSLGEESSQAGAVGYPITQTNRKDGGRSSRRAMGVNPLPENCQNASTSLPLTLGGAF
jgi:hypothetical protein